MLNATFNNISAISWWSVLLVEETGLSWENHRPAAKLMNFIPYCCIEQTSRRASRLLNMIDCCLLKMQRKISHGCSGGKYQQLIWERNWTTKRNDFWLPLWNMNSWVDKKKIVFVVDKRKRQRLRKVVVYMQEVWHYPNTEHTMVNGQTLCIITW